MDPRTGSTLPRLTSSRSQAALQKTTTSVWSLKESIYHFFAEESKKQKKKVYLKFSAERFREA
jgi:hypothetical protein